jgi:hypothetical protein
MPLPSGHFQASDAATDPVTPVLVEEFRALLSQACGLDLEFSQAWDRASNLIALYRMLMGPIPEDSGVQTSGDLPSPPVDDEPVLE